jgi:enoyl-CoA hydratase/carnithine racemase
MSDIQIESTPPLAWLTLNRPDRRNAVTSAMWQAVPHLAAHIEADATTRVALLRGAGQEAFSAGADIAEMHTALANPAQMQAMQAAVQVAQDVWARLPLPTIAVIHGACAGGGCGLALACDIRLAADDSFFAIPPAKLGLVYSLADTKRLVDLVGPSFAKEMLFTGRRVSAREAYDCGLVNHLFPAAELLDAARGFALDIAANAQNSVRGAKRVVGALVDGAVAETAATRAWYDDAFATPEFAEGARAFVEKRKPRF